MTPSIKKSKSKGSAKSNKSKGDDDLDDYDELVAESEIGKLGLSIFQMNKNKLQATNQRVLIHRVFYVAKLNSDVGPSVALNYLDAVVQKVTELSPNGQLLEPMTGMGLIYPTQTLHTVEGSADALLNYLSLIDPKLSDKSPFSVVKVICFAHDVSIRCFTSWTLRVIDIAAAIVIGGSDSDNTEPVNKVASDLINQVVRLSNFIQSTPPEKIKSVLDNLHEKAGAYLPAQDVIATLLNSNDRSIRLASDFVEGFKRPVLDGFATDVIWPIDLNVSPHNWSLMV